METTRERTTDEARALLMRRLDVRDLAKSAECELSQVYFKRASADLSAVITRCRPLIETAESVEALDRLEAEFRAALDRMRQAKAAGPTPVMVRGEMPPPRVFVPNNLTADTWLPFLESADAKTAAQVPALFEAAIQAGIRDSFSLVHAVRDRAMTEASTGLAFKRECWSAVVSVITRNPQALRDYARRLLLESEAADQAPGSEG